MLRTSDSRLSAAFDWARRQALAYALTGDPVGDWYEAALPGREAFCMRDTAHQSAGAHFLGLNGQTRNMLRKFAQNISDSKDWCSFWEINRYNLPAPADYQDDTKFWYNLPANFDILDACYRMYLLTGDSTYIDDPVFLNFYRRTVHDYVQRWDLSTDRIMARQRIMNIRGHPDPANRLQRNRGIPSYDEGDPNFTVAIDQLAAQYAGYVAYARIAQIRGKTDEAEEFLAQASALKALVNSAWWDSKSGSYYSRLNLDHQLEGHDLSQSLLYYGAAEDGAKSSSVLRSVMDRITKKNLVGIENQSYLPEILYKFGESEASYEQILDLTAEDKVRREYPEVSYSVLGAIVSGLMGITVEAAEQITTISRLTPATPWAELTHVMLRRNEIRVRHDGLTKSLLENVSGPALIWEACFSGRSTHLLVDRKPASAQSVERYGQVQSCATLPVGSGDSKVVQAVE